MSSCAADVSRQRRKSNTLATTLTLLKAIALHATSATRCGSPRISVIQVTSITISVPVWILDRYTLFSLAKRLAGEWEFLVERVLGDVPGSVSCAIPASPLDLIDLSKWIGVFHPKPDQRFHFPTSSAVQERWANKLDAYDRHPITLTVQN
ncbi:hypothetical protein [uncultured Zoogloea sp.]|uniref:hypothetical protein n=1 Tax=uncultured Zoogloea sp. TaxID=160237 RepID=UPI0026243605|nr:hypothetical protein [uncultured Zoogloea sp.]